MAFNSILKPFAAAMGLPGFGGVDPTFNRNAGVPSTAERGMLTHEGERSMIDPGFARSAGPGMSPEPAPGPAPDPIGEIIAENPGTGGFGQPKHDGLAGFVQNMGNRAAGGLYGGQAEQNRGNTWRDLAAGVLHDLSGQTGPRPAERRMAEQRQAELEAMADELGLTPKERFLLKAFPERYGDLLGDDLTDKTFATGDVLGTRDGETGDVSYSAARPKSYAEGNAEENAQLDYEAAIAGQEAAAERAKAQQDLAERRLAETIRANQEREKIGRQRAARSGGGGGGGGIPGLPDGFQLD